MDGSLFRWVNRVATRTGWAHGFFTDYAKYGVVLFAALLAVAYLDARRTNDLRALAGSVWAAGAALVALGIGQLVGGAIDRPRPYEAMTGVHLLVDKTADFSFPSDHATVAGAVAMGLLLANRRWGIVAGVAAIVMAVARVYVGAHYPGDVIAGLVLGALVAAVGGILLVPLFSRMAGRLARTRLRPLVSSRAAPVREGTSVPPA
jgi:undecaprenyl-diphosphatase